MRRRYKLPRADKKVKKGDTCYVWSDSSRDRHIGETKVKTSGKRWITVEKLNWDKFDAETLMPETGSYRFYPGSEQEYKQAIADAEEHEDLSLCIHSKMTRMPVEDLRKLKKIIDANFKTK